MRHDLLRFRFPTTGKLQAWRIEGIAQTDLDDRPALLTFTTMEAVRDAAIRGMGIGYMPDFLARDAIETGALVVVLDEAKDTTGQFWIVWPSSRHLSPKLRVFVDFCASRLFR